jgi:hypothetical protein
MKNPTPAAAGAVFLVNPGAVGILNVGDGDTTLSFDPKNPAERARAARIVKDMIRRGYCLLIELEVDGKKQTTRALDFHEDVCEYVIADFDSAQAAEADSLEEENGQDTQPSAAAPAGTQAAPAKRRYNKRSVSATSVRTVAVAPSAGG